MVFAASPESVWVLLPAGLSTSFTQFAVVLALRSMRKPVSLLELSLQERLMEDVETGTAASWLGADGALVIGGVPPVLVTVIGF